MEKVILYKKDHKGALRVWTIEEDDDEIIMEYGIEGGEMCEKFERIGEGKGGRDLDEQIMSRINSRMNSKLKSGYIKNRQEALDRGQNLNLLGFCRAMLAKRFERTKNVNLIGAIAQYKYDGHRCLVTNQSGEKIAYSKNGLVITSIDHILEGMEIPEGETVDGELYHHGTSLQRIGSWVKRSQPETKLLSLRCYDVVSDLYYPERLKILESITLGDHAEIAPCFKIVDIPSQFREAKIAGYEGLMIRTADCGYEDGKRSKSLLKVKQTEDTPMEDGEFLVIDILESKDGWARLVCVMNDGSGKTFKVSAPGNIPEKTRVLRLRKEFIGGKVRVEYANLTDKGIPFHPVALMWRAKESE